MDNLSFDATKETSTAELTALLILQELRMMRKDLNHGILKLHEEIKSLNPVCNSVGSANYYPDNIEMANNIEMPTDFMHSSTYETCQDSLQNGDNGGTDSAGGVFVIPENIVDRKVGISNSSKKIDKICEKMLIKQQSSQIPMSILQQLASTYLPSTSTETTPSLMPQTEKTCSKNLSNMPNTSENVAVQLQSPIVTNNISHALLFKPKEGLESFSKSLSKTSNVSENASKQVQPSNATVTNIISDSLTIYKPKKHLEGLAKSLKLTHGCKVCKKWFTSYHKLKRHYVEEHHQPNKHMCSFCGRSCYNAADLRIHIRTHTGEKPYQCNVCGKGFADKSNLTRHTRLRKNLTCSICQKVLCTKFQMHNHNLTHA